MHKTVTWEEVQTLQREGAPLLLVDVREGDEVMRGALPGARHIPLESLDFYAPMVLPDKDVLIVCYCMSGKRSRAAVHRLQELGYTQVANMPEGYLGAEGS